MNKLTRLAQGFDIGRVVCLLLLAAMVALRIWDPPPLKAVRARTFDFYQVVEPRQVTLQPAVIVDIDETSLNTIGQWPWPRTLLADFIVLDAVG
jgi:adenylate cyclase